MYQIRVYDGKEQFSVERASTIHARSTAERLAKKHGCFVQVFIQSPSRFHTGVEWVPHYTIHPSGELYTRIS